MADSTEEDNFYHEQTRLEAIRKDAVEEAIEKRNGFRRVVTTLILLQVVMFSMIVLGGIAGGFGILPTGGVVAVEISAPIVLIAAFIWMCFWTTETHKGQKYSKEVRDAKRELSLFRTDPKVYTERYLNRR